MLHHSLKKTLQIVLTAAGLSLLVIAVGLLAGWLDSPLSRFVAEVLQRQAKPSWPGYFQKGGVILFLAGIILLLNRAVLRGFNRLAAWGTAQMKAMDWWVKDKTEGVLDKSQTTTTPPALSFNRWDVLISLFFIFLALVYQLIVMSPGFPTVILGGDAGNIASFAAGRAYPELFETDAILGDLNNIGLYVTVHLPLAIWLEKLVGNFGLAYSLLLFPHAFLQYFSYYLFGRVLYRNRYWAFLFSLAASAPLNLDGGEVWGILPDAMPRFSFQVLIPFLLILLLTAWREQPHRWYWVMAIAGLMAFIHPVSTPVWGFALWLGFWRMFPAAWETRRKVLEMFKLAGILFLALLPYASIYLTYHTSGSKRSSYNLVHYILVEYFPSNLLDIPAAVNTLLHNTARFGLLWYALAGLLLTFLLFGSERPRLKQLLVWMGGIAVVSILLPWVEITIERTFRLIPLQTELMRGMRYLVPFLFVFWFYPFAELARRSLQAGLTRAVFATGTVLTLGWLTVNPPGPFTGAAYVFDCWKSVQFICPSHADHANALTYIREEIPAGSDFTVFLTNRWSGIEVRYLGLHPMVYAYKDKGQLAFTNLESLEQWHSYQDREDVIFSRKKTPTLEGKCEGILDFARDSGADYILTNFECPPELLLQQEARTLYRNSTYTILEPPADSSK